MRFIISIILIIASISVFILVTNPLWKGTQGMRLESAQFDEALDRSKELIKLRDALLSTYNSFPTDDLGKLDTMIPDSVDTVRLIIDINSVATRHNMSLADIDIGEPDSGQDPSSQVIGPTNLPYGTLPLSFVVSGTYSTFREFLADLERSLRLVDVSSVKFDTPDPKTDNTKYTVEIKTYWMK